MQKTIIQIATIHETNLNEKSTLKSPPGYCMIQNNSPEERGKGGEVAFIIQDRNWLQEPKLKTSDKHPEVQDI